MKISNEFTVHTPIERAWQVLTDLPGIAPCMPGARLTGVDGDVYQGKVKVKVGPVISEFAGTARFTEKDPSAYRAAIDAKGRDARSAGNAAAVVTAVLTASGDSTVVSVDTDLKISGKLAQFGSGMIKEVSGKLLAQFVTNLEAKLAAEDEGVTEAAGANGASAASSPEASSPEGSASSPAAGSSDSAAASTIGAPASGAASVSTESSTVSAAAGSGADTASGESSTVGAAASGAATATVADAAVSPADVAPAAVPSVEEAALAECPVPAQEPKPGGEADLAGTEPPAAIRTVPSPPSSPSASHTAGTASARSATSSATVAPSPVSRDTASLATTDDELEALDLLAVAGGSIYKRLVPVAIGVVAVGAVIVWLVARR
ncbi:SRPBCC family protein [Actinoplanes sp. TBRC 11911]|uniref:SRPBCC family protein n=1 Tax=Actinoplanes sp. TBRC 11911 TaxID=2729386 RepID=UPI00145EB595|nr:SRPBCC family protein [Actinoplanes sp. TBRC 11911]NMO51640.1 SRPBCC family protein [Actinoplanes sp. TBRC 11911]